VGSLIRLEAIAATQLPHTLSIRGFTAGEPPVRGQLVELRSWQFATQYLDVILARHGVQPIFSASADGGSGRVDLIPFEDLATRARAWSAFAADEEWIRLRKKCGCTVSGIALYRAL
jgi:hypothetical protein